MNIHVVSSTALCLLTILSAPAHAGSVKNEPVPSASAGWQQLTAVDVEAAYRLIADNHPGAVEALGDDDFRARFERGHAEALARIPHVDSYQGYSAALAGFATSFGDEHIWSNPKLRGLPYRWAGLVMSRRGGDWVVGKQEGAESLQGATLVECDGKSAQQIAKERLAFRVAAPIEAQYVAHGGFMFVDDGNPFVGAVARCTFEGDGGTIEHLLDWRPVPTAELAEALQDAMQSASAGFGVRQVNDMTWIALERLSEDAEPVLGELESTRARWLSSPAIVVDVRGNGGGDSRYGRRLAELIFGKHFVQSRLKDTSVCGALWRASPDNAEQLEAIAARANDAGVAQYYHELAQAVRSAIAEGQPFDEGIPECENQEATLSNGAEHQATSDYGGKVILLTDHACFSSCLLLTKEFRQLGALHVGEQTNMSTRYMEVREIDLPSGLSSFSTLQKVVIGGDAEIGPYSPTYTPAFGTFDTKRLEDWIPSLL